MSTTGRSGLQGLIVAMLFLGPLVAAFIIYYGIGDYSPPGGTQNGDLLQPTITLEEAALPTPGGGSTGPQWLQRRWSLLLYEPDACDETCLATLDQLHRVWKLLNRDQIRVQRVLVTAQSVAGPETDDELVVGWLDGGEIANQLSSAAAGAPAIFVVDPLGNLVLRYATDAPPKAVLSDMKKLLKLSRIG